MKKRALWKSIRREIFESKARFLSILGIILLGVCFYAGIKATGPVMVQTSANYYAEANLMDGKIISTLGITQGDLDILAQDPTVEDYQAWYSHDLNVTSLNRVVRFYGYDSGAKNQLNRFKLIEGRLPTKKGEIALDALAIGDKKYKIGDTFAISGDKKELENFKTTSFEIVGFVKSPMFIENVSRGNTTIGKGSVDYFGVIDNRDFNLATYSEVYVTYKDLSGVQAYSDEYDNKMAVHLKNLKANFEDRPAARLGEIRKKAEPELNQARKKIEDGKKALAEGQAKLTKAEADLAQGKIDLANGEVTFANSIANGEGELAANKQKIIDGKAELARQETTLANALSQLKEAEQKLNAAREQLVQRGIDPNLDPNLIENQIKQLGQYQVLLNKQLAALVSLANEVPDGELIAGPNFEALATEAINALKQVPDLDLSQWDISEADLTSLAHEISQTEMTPALRQEILAAAAKVQTEINNLPNQAAPLTELAAGLRQYQQGLADYHAGLAQYNSGQAQLNAAKEQLNQGENQLANGYTQLAQAKSEGEAKLAESRTKLAAGEKELREGQAKLATESQKLTKGEADLAKAEKELAEIPLPDYLFFERADNPGYSEYYENSQRISSIATVFPVFFFMIAALVSLTTMTRMVDEKRGEIGTLKALGYKNHEIALKYIVYATMASVIGTGLGLLLGFNLFPKVIIDAYGSLYNLPSAVPTYFLSYSLQSLVVSLMCTLISAMLVLRYDLLSAPASLMRPKAPKAGQRIILERLSFIWRRLNFNQKVTARNLFRYKQRMFMTVFGIAGCMALILTGFGLRDSISDVVSLQFGKLWHYQGIVTYRENTTAEDLKNYEAALGKEDNLDKRLIVAQQSMRAMAKGKTTQTVTVDVPQQTADLADFVLFNDRRSGQTYELDDSGVIINEKLAKMFNLKVGEMLPLTSNDDQKHELKISAIVENYAMHFVYLTPKYYQEVFGKKPTYNSELLLFKDNLKKADEDQIATDLLAQKQVINVTFLTAMSDSLDDTIQSLNIVMWVLIVSAATLAFIVLYNLTNINISERIRELSTIKVLGFYPNEVTSYVYRENNILTLLGIIVGGILGKLLHSFVLQTAEVDILMFSPTIHWQSYVYAGLLTIFFSFLVMLVMHRKLKKVDMISALKANE